MQDAVRKILDIIFPPHPDVVAARQVTEEALLEKICCVPAQQQGVYTGLSYRDPAVRALIRANKFHADTHAAELLGTVFDELLAQVHDEYALDTSWHNPILVPVPSSQKKRRERGENQVERIMQHAPQSLARFQYLKDALGRHDRPSQARIPRAKREDNIRGAFFSRNNADVQKCLVGASVFLIDDVTESGATMQDAMRALKEAGAGHILGIALAK